MPLTNGSGRVRSLILVVGLSIALGNGWGCADRSQVVEVEGPMPGEDIPIAVDATNTNGEIHVHVDPSVARPRVDFEVRPGNVKTDTKKSVIDTQGQTSAIGKMQDGRYTLTVQAKSDKESADRPFVVVDIVVPRCDGLYIRNSGGPVEAVGVTGAVHIENGVGGAPGGRIEVRTAAPMHEPVMLFTSEGPVFYQVGADASGRFDLTAEQGKTEFRAYLGNVTGSQNYSDHCLCTLNGGTNPVSLRSGRGVVRAMVMTDPVDYIPYRTDLQDKYLGTFKDADNTPTGGTGW